MRSAFTSVPIVEIRPRVKADYILTSSTDQPLHGVDDVCVVKNCENEYPVNNKLQEPHDLVFSTSRWL